MKNEFLSFRKFNSPEQAEQLLDILTNNGIPYFIVDETSNYDPSTLSGTSLQKTIMIKIKSSDFILAEKLLGEAASQNLENADKDYYLFSFKDEELIEILLKPDEWNAFDIELSKKILKEKGKAVNPELIEALRKQRLEDLARQEPSQKNWIIIGYICSIAGGFLGVCIGWHLMSYRKKLPNGELVYSFNDSDRKNGKIILITGILFITFWLIVRICLEISKQT
jgi:hypothetical protein